MINEKTGDVTIDAKVQDIVADAGDRKGFVLILAGSPSDEKHIEELHKEFDRWLIPHDVVVSSAHKMPVATKKLVQAYNALEGMMTFVTVAGGTDALSGGVSFYSNHLTISSPPDGFNDTCLRNPPHSSNLYILTPAGIARFIAQQYRGVNTWIKSIMKEGTKGTLSSIPEGTWVQDQIKSNNGYAVVLAVEEHRPERVSKLAVSLAGYNVPFTVETFPTNVHRNDIRAKVMEYNALDGSMVYITTHNIFSYAACDLHSPALHPMIYLANGSARENCIDSNVANVICPENAARAVAQMYASSNPKIREALEMSIAMKVSELQTKGPELKRYANLSPNIKG